MKRILINAIVWLCALPLLPHVMCFEILKYVNGGG